MKETPKGTAKTSSPAFAVGKQEEESSDIRLLPVTTKNLAKANSDFPELPGNLYLPKVLDIGTIFFYEIVLYNKCALVKDKVALNKELGIGLLKKEGRNQYLERLEAKKIFTPQVGWRKPRKLTKFCHEEFLTVRSIPIPYEFLFSVKDTVVCSLGGGVGELVYLDEGEVLAKNSGDVKGIPLKDLLSKLSVIDLMGGDSRVYSNSLVLKSQKSRPKDPEEGTIIFNKRTKGFEGYDGKKWKKLDWKD